jgi:hypothetical protein
MKFPERERKKFGGECHCRHATGRMDGMVVRIVSFFCHSLQSMVEEKEGRRWPNRRFIIPCSAIGGPLHRQNQPPLSARSIPVLPLHQKKKQRWRAGQRGRAEHIAINCCRCLVVDHLCHEAVAFTGRLRKKKKKR